MTRSPVSDIRQHKRHDRRTQRELLRSVLWVLSCAYVSVGAYLDGVRGALVTVVALTWICLVLLRGEHR
jgi:hypothetical protein